MSTQNIKYLNSTIRYAVRGSGKAVVLLHGYLESLEIWKDFAIEIAENYQVIVIDLPGHGKSTFEPGFYTVEFMAECVNAVLEELKISKTVIIGHSMGSYAMMAFAEKYPQKLAGIGFFHSITWADLPEKKEARVREIELVKLGKKNLICNVNIPKSFADDNLTRFKDEIEWAKEIALNTPDDGIIAALTAMKNRKDRTLLLEKLTIPVFFAIGKKDNYIPMEKNMAITTLPIIKYVVMFEHSGHMAFIEERDMAVDEIEHFLETCNWGN